MSLKLIAELARENGIDSIAQVMELLSEHSKDLDDDQLDAFDDVYHAIMSYAAKQQIKVLT